MKPYRDMNTTIPSTMPSANRPKPARTIPVHSEKERPLLAPIPSCHSTTAITHMYTSECARTLAILSLPAPTTADEAMRPLPAIEQPVATCLPAPLDDRRTPARPALSREHGAPRLTWLSRGWENVGAAAEVVAHLHRHRPLRLSVPRRASLRRMPSLPQPRIHPTRRK